MPFLRNALFIGDKEGNAGVQLKLLTDYSIRFVLYLAQQQRGARVPGIVIAKRMGIGSGYVRRVAAGLQKKGIVGSEQGYQGGFYLIQPPDRITLFDVLEAAEDTMKLNRCLESELLCDRGAAPHCKVHQVLTRVQDSVECQLKEIRITDLL